MAKLATIIIPVGPAHGATGIYKEAEASARAQTIPCNVITVHDTEGRGAAWARNRGAEQADSLFLVFLDADDLLAPTFIEQTASAYKPGYYVYTDWWQHDRQSNRWHVSPDELDTHNIGQQHITTTLLPRAAWSMVGGFDESFATLEDEAFYRAITAMGWCGVRCPQSLVTYRRNKGVSLVNPNAHDVDVVQERVKEYEQRFYEQYRKLMGMPCNCVGKNKQTTPIGEQQPGDVLVTVHYSKMKKRGPVTGRYYPRAGNGKTLWIAPQDAEARPEWWQPVNTAVLEQSPDPAAVDEHINTVLVPEDGYNPDISKINRIADTHYGRTKTRKTA